MDAICILKNNSKINDKELCEKLGILYYTDEDCWPVLKEWLINHGCDKNILVSFRLRWNALYCWEKIQKNPNVTLEELRKEREI